MKAFKAISVFVLVYFSFAVQAQNISGTIFTDSNNNGVKDATEVGFPNATITAYATGNTAVATTTSSNTGSYTLTGLTAGTKYRVEFSPFVGFTDGAIGSSNLSSVQFVNAGSSNVNFGIFLPGKCGTDPDPRIIGTCGLFNNPSVDTTVASWRYATNFYQQTQWEAFTYTNTIHPHEGDMAAGEIGVPWAMARIPSTNYVLNVPVSSPATGVFATGGVAGTSAIYMANYNGVNASYTDHKLLVRLADHGINLTATHPIGADQPRFGEYGLGGLTVSADAKYVYVANLGKGNLIRVDISGVNYGSLPSTAPGAAQITEISYPTTMAGFTSGVDGYFRATALKQFGGDIYIAGTFDGSLRSDDSAVRVVVLKLTVATNSITEVFNFNPMNFVVGNISTFPISQSRWTAGPDVNAANGQKLLQPVVSGFDFDNYGAITLGITNRGVYNLQTNLETGYIVSTWRNADGSFTLESGGSRGPLTAANFGTTMHLITDTPAPGLTGPGLDVFYDQSISGHSYLFNGGVLNITRENVMAFGMTDAVGTGAFGVRYDRQNDGGIIGGIHIGGGKIYALVGVDAVCVIKDPVEIGNYVWRDNNNNGIQDGDEPSIPNVTVQLVNTGGTVIATAVTNSDGYYVFSTDPNRTSSSSHIYQLSLTSGANYTVRIPNISGGSQQSALSGLFLTPKDLASDNRDSDGNIVGVNAETTLTLGNEGQNNHNLDFGFGTMASCSITITGVPESCNPASNKYTLIGQAVFTNPPLSGTLTVSVSGGGSQTFNAPFTSPQSYNIAGQISDGASHTVTAVFSAEPTCVSTSTYTAPESCEVNCCVGTNLFSNPSIENGTFDVNASVVDPNNADFTAVYETDITDWERNEDTYWINDPTRATDGDRFIYLPSPYLCFTKLFDLNTEVSTCKQYKVCFDVAAFDKDNPNGGSLTSGIIIEGKYWSNTFGQGEDVFTITDFTDVATMGPLSNPMTITPWNNLGWKRITATITLPPATIANASWFKLYFSTPLNTVLASDGKGVLLDNVCITEIPTTPITATCAKTDNSNCATPNGTASVTTNATNPTYIWNNGATTSSINGLSNGTYTVTVTETTTGCTNSCQAVVGSTTTLPTATCAKTDNSNCATPNGTASVTTNATNPTYIWNNGATTSSINGLSNGTYTVTVTETTTGCTNSCQAVVGSTTTLPTATCAKTDNTNCGTPNGTASVTTNATNPTYIWNNGATTSSINGLSNGTYTVTVTETTTGCTNSCQAVVGSTTTLPTATCAKTDNTNCATPNGTASVTTNANQILWSTGATTSTISGLSANTYTVTVTNTVTGCTNTCQATVGSTTTLPTATCAKTDNTNCATPNGTASVTTNANQILWSTGATTSTISGLSANTYTVTVTNTVTGCTNTCQAVVANGTVNPTCNITANSQPSCANLTGGSITVNPSPAGIYTYNWSDLGAGSATRTGLTGGTYTVTVSNTTTSCTGICQVTLTTPTNCCNISAIVPQNIICYDNGTPGLNTDNRIRFNANVTNTNTSLTSYNVMINGGTTITPNTNVLYGVTQFTLGPGTAGGGATFTVTVTDSATSGCTQTFQIVDPGTCTPGIYDCPTPQCGAATIQTNGN